MSLHQNEVFVEFKRDILCPRCSVEGPHERLDPAPDGSFVAMLCRSCGLSWKVFG